MTTPIVSVVIPTHNRADLVADCVRSVLAQEDCRVEVIVVDDCSTDRTGDVLSEFGDSISVIRPETNIERGAARNLGASKASSDLVAFVDSDDIWEPHKLNRQLPFAGDGVATVSGVSFIDGRGRDTGRRYVPPTEAPDRVLVENPYLAGPSTLLMPTALFREVGGFPEEREVQGSEDWLFFIKLVLHPIKIAVVPEPLVRYRIHEGNSTASVESVARCMWAATTWLEAHGGLDQLSLMRVRGYTAGVIARQFAARGRWAEATKWVGRARSSGTRSAGMRAAGWVVLSGLRGRVKASRRSTR